MGKRKTELDYESDIAILHRQLLITPDSSPIKKKIAYRVKKWMELVDIRIQVAQNEQHPWTSDMLGFITERMPTKKITGINQTGDYVGVVTSSTGYRYIDTVVERKEISDLYGTLIPEDGRKRFYREIERFKMDERFNKMVIIVEGTLSDFVMYQPEFNAGEFDYGRRFDVNKNSTINEKKMTVLADLLVAGVLVMFCDNPTLAAQMCGRMFRESVRKEYWKILNL